MDRRQLDRARSISTIVFGAKHRLPVTIVIARGPKEGMYASDLASQVRASETQVGQEIQRLKQIGLLLPLPPPSPPVRGRPPQRYQRRDSPYWQLAEQLLARPPKPSIRAASPSSRARA